MFPFIRTQRLSLFYSFHPLSFFFSSSTATKLPADTSHNFFKLVHRLKDKKYLQQLLHRQRVLLRRKEEGRFEDVKEQVNQLLEVGRLVTWAQAYHDARDGDDVEDVLLRAEQLITLAFSAPLQPSGYTIQPQSSSPLFLHLYYSLLPRAPHPKISLIYLNAHFHLVKEEHPLQLLRCWQAMRDVERRQIQEIVWEKSREEIGRQVEAMDRGKEGRVLGQIQMALFIAHYKGTIGIVGQQQRTKVVECMLAYLHFDSLNLYTTHLHLQNILYIIYLLVTTLNMPTHLQTWLNSSPNPATLAYLSQLFAHEDKFSCLKIQIWLKMRTNESWDIVGNMMGQMRRIDCRRWRYKYVTWIIDTLIAIEHQHMQEVVTKLYNTAFSIPLRPHHPISSLFSPLIHYAHQQPLTPFILTLQTLLSTYLSHLTPSLLLSHPPSLLTLILPHADRHPALHRLYLPYLLILLKTSLGQFQWSIMTQLYYFGLRWGAMEIQEGGESMEWVRRYIMNQYVSMGILRRQIPAQSYFYKIHEETTPEMFYQNYIER